MCMGGPGCMGSKAKSGNSYTPKKSGGRASKGSYTPRGTASTINSFGKPTIRSVSFSGKN